MFADVTCINLLMIFFMAAALHLMDVFCNNLYKHP